MKNEFLDQVNANFEMLKIQQDLANNFIMKDKVQNRTEISKDWQFAL